MGIKHNFTLFFTGLVLVGVVVYYGYNLLSERTNESGNITGGSAETLVADDQKLRLKGLSDKSISEVKIIASSTRDGNAVVEIDGRTTIFSVGNKVTISGNSYLVLQVASHQLALRSIDGHNQNDIFLIKKDLSSGVSTMLRVSSDVALEFPVSGIPSINSN
ncbi:MAG: hypothetical protein JKX81_18625 [Arenicella sp.]|nr:hypothetical protein [Arenicella sp.]